MKNDIYCATCPMMKIIGRARYTDDNNHIVRPCGVCFCGHPDAIAAFELLCPCRRRMPGFIAYTDRASDLPAIKTAPRWCPRKMYEKPVEINKQQASQVIETRKPRGMFFLAADNVVTGIDNRTGDAWTEVFATKRKCLMWLRDYRSEE